VIAGNQEQVGRVARQAINSGDYEHVAVADLRHEFLELRAIDGRAADLLPKHMLASCGLQLGKLVGEVLGVGRNAGVAVNHALIMEQFYGTEKGNSASGLGLFQIS
jgi:hypothetical protein